MPNDASSKRKNAQNMDVQQLLAQVSPERLIHDVECICTGERLTNAAESKALDFMAAEFEKAGCRVHRESHLAYISTPEAAFLAVNGREFECVTHPMTPSVDHLEAPLEYVSNDRLFNLAAGSLAGRIALVHGLAVEPKVRALQAAGALGVVFITGKLPHAMIVSKVWGAPAPSTMNDYVSIPAASISTADGDALCAQLQAGAPCTAVLETRVHTRWTDLPILVADIPGESDDFVMITSHIDSWWLGAMDNASGNACGLEIARILAPLARAGKLRRGIRIVNWSGHSHGRYAGSTAYCDAHFEELEGHFR